MPTNLCACKSVKPWHPHTRPRSGRVFFTSSDACAKFATSSSRFCPSKMQLYWQKKKKNSFMICARALISRILDYILKVGGFVQYMHSMYPCLYTAYTTCRIYRWMIHTVKYEIDWLTHTCLSQHRSPCLQLALSCFSVRSTSQGIKGGVSGEVSRCFRSIVLWGRAELSMAQTWVKNELYHMKYSVFYTYF